MGEQGGGEERGVDSTTKGSKTRLSASTFNICLSDGCARHVYDSSMLRGYQTGSHPEGIPLLQYTDDSTFLMEGSVEETKDLSTLLDLFIDFLGVQIKCAKSIFVGFGLTQEERS